MLRLPAVLCRQLGVKSVGYGASGFLAQQGAHTCTDRLVRSLIP
jgi:hypothetical protein